MSMQNTRKSIPGKRPFWVWTLSLYFGIFSAWCLYVYYCIETGAFAVPQPAEKYMFAARISSFCGIVPALGLASAWSLFFMRKSAFLLFCTFLGAGLVSGIISIFYLHGTGEIDPAQNIAGPVIGYAITAAACLYAHRLNARSRKARAGV